MLLGVSSGLAFVVAPPALLGSSTVRHRQPASLRAARAASASFLMQEGGECTIIGEEQGPEGKVWFACDDDSSTVEGAECAEEDFGTGGGLGILPDDGQQVLCKADKVSGGKAVAAGRRQSINFIGQDLPIKPLDGGECVIIGEQANGEVWYVCSEDAAVEGAECSEEDFGTGGGIGILPQDGEKLCKAPPPRGFKSPPPAAAITPITKFKGSSFHGSGK